MPRPFSLPSERLPSLQHAPNASSPLSTLAAPYVWVASIMSTPAFSVIDPLSCQVDFSRTRARFPSGERGSSFSTPSSTRIHQVTRPSPAPPTRGAVVLETLCSTAFRALLCSQLTFLDLTRAFARLSQFLGSMLAAGTTDGASGQTLCALATLCALVSHAGS